MSPFVSQCQNVTLLFRCTCILKSNFPMPVKISHLVFRAFLDPKVLLLSMCLKKKPTRPDQIPNGKSRKAQDMKTGRSGNWGTIS